MVTHSSIITGDLSSGSVLSYYYDAEHPSKDIGSTIVNKFATDEFAKFAAKTYEYAQKGFISPSCQSTATANDYRTATQSTGDYLFGTQSYAFGCELDFSKAPWYRRPHGSRDCCLHGLHLRPGRYDCHLRYLR